MKNKIDHLKLGLLVLAVACTLSYAQNEVRRERERSAETSPRAAPPPQSEASKDELKVSEQTLHNEVTDSNKASKIIGMEVKNRENERVGRVKDIVIDVKSGQVAYTVLSTGLFGGGKLIAVPLDALTLQPGAKNFVIDAPKERLESAQGFADNNWPPLDAAKNDQTIGLAGSSAESPSKNATGEENGTKTQSQGPEKRQK